MSRLLSLRSLVVALLRFIPIAAEWVTACCHILAPGMCGGASSGSASRRRKYSMRCVAAQEGDVAHERGNA